MTEPPPTRKVAIVVPGINLYHGGLLSVTRFLYRLLEETEGYYPDLITVATARNDSSSVRLLHPQSWPRGVQTTKVDVAGMSGIHVGAKLVEFEFQRYAPRPALNKILNRYDLVQIISGSPACAMIGKEITQPVVSFAATLITAEREAKLRRGSGLKRAWARVMTSIMNRLDHLALQHVVHIFVINRWMFDYMSRHLGEDHVSLAIPGIDTSVFYPARSFAKDGFILSVGRFDDPRKNVRLLFQAYHLVRTKFPDAPNLVLAGHTKPTPVDMQIAYKLGISENVHFFKNVSTSELAKLYRQARLFVLSSSEEGLGIVLMEAMASALPVVSTRCGGPETVVNDEVSGYLVQPDDPEPLAEKMADLLRDDQKSQLMGLEGKAIVDKDYSLEMAGKVFLNVYDGILG